MVVIQTGYQKRLTSFWLGRKCVFCGKRRVCLTARGRVKCLKCNRQKSLKKQRKELAILLAFVEQRPAYQVALEFHVSYPVVTRVFRNVRELLYHQCELEGKRLSGDIVNHNQTLVSRSHNHINGIEGFWSYAKHKLYNYRGVSRSNLALYLKEMEYRYNHRKDNILEPIISLYFGYVSY